MTRTTPDANDALTAAGQATSLGPPATWPALLRNLFGVMSGLPNAAFIVWGPQEALLCNDAFRTMAAVESADTFGQTFSAARMIGAARRDH